MTCENEFNMRVEDHLTFIWWMTTGYTLGMNTMKMKFNMLRFFILMNAMQCHVWAQEIMDLESHG